MESFIKKKIGSLLKPYLRCQCSPKISIIIEISGASPGSLKDWRNCRSASSILNPRKSKDLTNALRTSKFFLLEIYSPIIFLQRCGFSRRKRPTSIGSVGLERRRFSWRYSIPLLGFMLNCSVPVESSFFLCLIAIRFSCVGTRDAI